MAVVVFDPSAFATRYPEFSALSSALTQLYFNEACIYLNNTDASKVTDINVRTTLLNMITAHIAALNSTNGNQSVGRINSATEGTVTVSFEMSPSPNNMQSWFMQTQYGSSYWAASAPYRTMQYFIPTCTPISYNVC